MKMYVNVPAGSQSFSVGAIMIFYLLYRMSNKSNMIHCRGIGVANGITIRSLNYGIHFYSSRGKKLKVKRSL